MKTIKFVLTLSLFLTLLSCQSLKLSLFSSFIPVAQGFTTSSETIIRVLRPKEAIYTYTYFSKQNFTGEKTVSSIQTTSRDFSKWALDQFVVKGLKVEDTYQLNISAQNGKLLDSRQFYSLDLNKKTLKFAAASCMRYKGFSRVQKKIWPHMIANKPDIIFLIGDNAYTTWNHYIAPRKDLWKFYVLNRRTLSLYASKVLTPILASWDDHDYGYNNGGKEYIHKDESYLVFKAFFGNDLIKSPYIKTGPGISYVFEAYGQRFFFMDNRSFREHKVTYWGKKQTNWLFKHLRQKTKPSWIISGNQFFGAYHPHESFEGGFPEDFKNFLNKLNKISSPVAFLGGDRHLFELMKITSPDLNYTTYEVTSSGIHSYLRDKMWEKTPNPRQVFGFSGRNSYAIIETEKKSPNSFYFTVENFEAYKKKPIYSNTLRVKK